jgi:MFS family permease
MLADYFPPERRGRAIGLYSMGVYLGIGLAAIIGAKVIGALADEPPVHLPVVGELAAWHLTFLIVGLPGLLVAAWVALLREPPRRVGPALVAAAHSPVATAATVPSDASALAPAAAPPTLAVAFAFLRANATTFGTHFLGFSLLTLLFNAVVFWMAPYLVRAHGLSPAEFGVTLGTILALGGAAGIYAGGALADALRRRGVRDAELWSGIVGALGVWPTGVLATTAATADASLAWFAAFMLFASLPFAAAAAGLTHVTPNRLRGLVSAVYLFCVNLAGIGLGSFLTGFVNDHVLGDPNRVGESMAWIVGLAAPAAALVLLAGRRAYRASAARVGA